MMSNTTRVVPAESTRLGRAFAPVVAPLLRSRWVSLSLAAAGSLQVGAALAHLPGMPCPILHLFHVPCPGCGLSRACAATLHTDFGAACRLHAFAPLFLLAIALFWLAALLPSARRIALVRWMEHFERRTWLPTLLLIGLVLYWAARLVYAQGQLTRIVAG
ncbi:MAG TPA: DUF2752 domain-containing protein [Tepidisphaeraceae bacterium]|jgi:hypothetical protein